MRIRNALSLFDGISCGRVALDRAGIEYDNYYASEVDPYAIKIATKNYPDTIHLGDVCNWIEWKNIFDWSTIDLIVGGSPCQGFSFAGRELNFADRRSALYFVFENIVKHCQSFNPDVKFMLENVRMSKRAMDTITERLGVNPVAINSRLVSAQNRSRLYWANWEISQPDDKGIMLQDVVFPDAVFAGRVVGRKLVDGVRKDHLDIHAVQRLELRTDGKSPTLTTVTKDYTALNKDGFAIAMHNLYGGWGETKNRTSTEKSPTIRTPAGGGHIPSLLLSQKALDYMNRKVKDGRDYWDFAHHSDVRNGKSATVVSVFYKGVPYNVLKTKNLVRAFHPIECERLQTLPDNYTEGVSKTQRYKAIGNGWTVDVIAHIFECMKGTDHV